MSDIEEIEQLYMTSYSTSVKTIGLYRTVWHETTYIRFARVKHSTTSLTLSMTYRTRKTSRRQLTVGDAFRRTQKWQYVGRHGNQSAGYDFLFGYCRHYTHIYSRLTKNELFQVWSNPKLYITCPQKFIKNNLNDISSGLAALELNYNYFWFLITGSSITSLSGPTQGTSTG